MLPELRRPGKGGLQLSEILADGFLVIDMERGGIFLDDFFQPGLGKGKTLFTHGQFLLVDCNLVN